MNFAGNIDVFIWEVKNFSLFGIAQGAIDMERYLTACGGTCASGRRIIPTVIQSPVGPLVVLNGITPGVVHYTNINTYLAWRKTPANVDSSQQLATVNDEFDLAEIDGAIERYNSTGRWTAHTPSGGINIDTSDVGKGLLVGLLVAGSIFNCTIGQITGNCNN